MARGERSAREVMEEHLRRLRQCNPSLNAALAIFADQALAEAGAPRPGPLSGLPISVKETFGLAGSTITAGSMRMPPVMAESDAEAVARLKAAGAIVLARANVPEFVMAGETENPRYGRTNNPWDLARTCGGSSGGDGALVAAGCVAAGLGSDILGSIRIPASFCGVVGFKPASAAVSKRGHWPGLEGLFTDSWLAVGPIARSVRDVRLLYGILTGTPLAAGGPVAGRRLILPGAFPLAFRDAAIAGALASAEQGLLAAGMHPERVALGDVDRWYRSMVRYLAWELMPLLRAGLTTAGGQRFSLWREGLGRLRGRGEVYDGLYRLLLVGPLVRYRRDAPAHAAADLLEAARSAVRARLGDDGVMLLPTLGLLAPRHGEMNRLSLRPGVNRLMTPLTLCNYLDLPAVTVPAWRHRDAATGLAPGLMLVSAPGAEGLLLDTAQVLETVIGDPVDRPADTG
jgi:Asp-tRNA(Asn)/Glu-tRNA(Gln) amidotransferase A subunit family amidase